MTRAPKDPAARSPRPESNEEVWLIIPALDEEESLPLVLRELPPIIHRTLVVDNGSKDRTAEVAEAGGASVIKEERRGYGRACQTGIAALPASCTIVAFLDADYSDRPSDLDLVLEPILLGRADFVVGSRTRGELKKGALLFHQRFGNWLATSLIRLLFAQKSTDLGPLRAIRKDALAGLGMRDENYGWTVEMQVRAALSRLRTEEVPVAYRPRIGKSKISGTIKGSFRAGTKILGTVFGLYLGVKVLRQPLSGMGTKGPTDLGS